MIGENVRNNKLALLSVTAAAFLGGQMLHSPDLALAQEPQPTLPSADPNQPPTDPCDGTWTQEGAPGSWYCEPNTPAPAPAPSPTPPAKKPERKGLRDYYNSPFEDVNNLMPLRIDQGVDYKGEGPVRAIGEGIVILATNNSRYWGNEGGHVVVYKLTEGPAKNRRVFVSENCDIKVREGQRVHKATSARPATTICHMHANFPFIETGWATESNDRQTLDHPAAYSIYSQHPDGSETRLGLNFDRLMRALGVPGGNTVPGHVSTNRGKLIGHLSKKYKNWSAKAR